MCEMIYLGFKGRYNLRLGEILQLTFRYISAVEKTGNRLAAFGHHARPRQF